MKKSIFCLVAAVGLLTACDPVQSEKDFDQATLTAEQLKNSCTVTVEQENGVNINRVHVKSTAPISTYWTNNIVNINSASGDFTMLVTGEQEITCYAVNNDGSIVSTTFPVNIQAISEKYPVDPAWGLLYGDGKKDWTWDTSSYPDQWFAGAGWGNLGYAAGSGESFVTGGNGIWWGAKPEELTGQLQHSNTGVATGEEDANAYMTFTLAGTKIQKYDANGNAIGNGGTLTFDMTPTYNGDDVWALGKLKVTEGALLFPFKINGGGFMPGEFEIMQLDETNLKLIYADAGTGSWNEATWWAFKAK